MKKYTLNNLDCANCASKIESEIRKLESVRFVSINFATKILNLDGDDIESVRKTVRRIEPEIIINDPESKEENSRSKLFRQIVFISISLLFFAGAQLLSKYFANRFAVMVLYLVAYFIAGFPVLIKAARNIFHGRIFDENFLMTLSTIGAFAIQYPAEGSAVMIFYRAGEFFQELSIGRSRRSIKSLLEIKSEIAHVMKKGVLVDLEPDNVRVGDILIVKPGERIPVDGTVTEGKSFIDKSAITGESLPVFAEEGSDLLSGSINKSGVLTFRAEKLFAQSQASRILSLVEDAQQRKAKAEKFITVFARYYTPAVVAAATLVAIIPPLVIGAEFTGWIHRALVLLVISCPCALVVSIPLGYFGGIGGASRKGILVKGSEPLDSLAAVSTVVFDKTGTLTGGEFSVIDVVAENGFTREEILSFASDAEFHSNHPVALSLRSYSGGSVAASDLEDYHEIAGYGVAARVKGRNLLVGNDRILHRENIEHSVCRTEGTSIHVVIDRIYAGYILVADTPKEDSGKAIKSLHDMGVRVVMLTGDSHPAASHIAQSLDIKEFHADLLPGDKVAILEQIIAENHKGKVAFVGDGINDAPVIARADVGIAMGMSGSDAAVETADVVLMTDSPAKIPEAIMHARRTHRIVIENIIFALGVKGFFSVLGVAGIATMWEAVFADMGVAIIAIFNSMRAMRLDES